jgi:hypothetical protein
LKKTQAIPQALRTPGTLPAARAGSTNIEKGEKTRTKAKSRPNNALTKRIIQPYQPFRLVKIPIEAPAKVETSTEGG